MTDHELVRKLILFAERLADTAPTMKLQRLRVIGLIPEQLLRDARQLADRLEREADDGR